MQIDQAIIYLNGKAMRCLHLCCCLCSNLQIFVCAFGIFKYIPLQFCVDCVDLSVIWYHINGVKRYSWQLSSAWFGWANVWEWPQYNSSTPGITATHRLWVQITSKLARLCTGRKCGHSGQFFFYQWTCVHVLIMPECLYIWTANCTDLKTLVDENTPTCILCVYSISDTVCSTVYRYICWGSVGRCGHRIGIYIGS